MGYSTTAECDLILAQALTSSSPDPSTTGRVSLININSQRDTNRIPNQTVEYYITLADSQIDGILSQQYFTPFNQCAHGEWLLDEDINAPDTGTDALGTDSAGQVPLVVADTVVMDSSSNLVPGDEIILHDDLIGTEELLVVATIVDQNTVTVSTEIEGTFLVDSGVRIIRLRFPPPLNQISARLAASFIYDKYFAAQAQPSISDYGKEMRLIATGQMNDILNGKTLIKCARRRGGMFDNPWLDSAYGAAAPWNGFDTNERDMSRPK